MKKKSLFDAQAMKSDQAAKEAQKQTRTVDFSVLVGYQLPTRPERSILRYSLISSTCAFIVDPANTRVCTAHLKLVFSSERRSI